MGKVSRQDIKQLFTVAYTIFGEDWKFGKTEYPAKKQDYDFGVKFFALASNLLAEGKIKPHPATVKQGGLEGILEGLQELRENKVSGAKLVYQIQ